MAPIISAVVQEVLRTFAPKNVGVGIEIYGSPMRFRIMGITPMDKKLVQREWMNTDSVDTLREESAKDEEADIRLAELRDGSQSWDEKRWYIYYCCRGV